MNVAYRDFLANAGADAIRYLGLVDDAGRELDGGGYFRQPVRWHAATAGTIRPQADAVFNVPPGATVAGWRAFAGPTAGVDYGGASFTPEVFHGAGVFTLFAEGTGIAHDAGR